MKNPQTPPVIVIGMHRSGTSLIARLLSDLGVFMGDEMDSNHESLLFQGINNDLLSMQKSNWAKPRAFVDSLSKSNQLDLYVTHILDKYGISIENYLSRSYSDKWGWKDPRNTLTLRIWTRIFTDTKVIFITRNCQDVSLSLRRRELSNVTRKGEHNRKLIPTISNCLRLCEYYKRIGAVNSIDIASVLLIKYESITDNMPFEITRIAEFIDSDTSSDGVLEIAGKHTKTKSPHSLIDKLGQIIINRKSVKS